MIVGSGKFRYRVNVNWAKLPAGWSFKEVGGVGVDSNDNSYVNFPLPTIIETFLLVAASFCRQYRA